MSFFLRVKVIPYIKGVVKAVFKPSNQIDISVSEFVDLYGANKISTFASIGANDGNKNDPIAKHIKKADGME